MAYTVVMTRPAVADPAEQARLAVVLTSLAQILAGTAAPALAVPAAREAVAIMRRLAEGNPDGYLPGLAAALVALSAHLAPPAGRSRSSAPAREAVRLAAEAVEICHQLAAANPLAYEPDLAAALTNLGLRYAVAGQAREAVTATEQAVDLRRRLAGRDPRRHRTDLAASLNNLALQRSATRRRADALAPAHEAVEVYRQLQDELPPARWDLAAALTNLGYLLAAAGRDDEAFAPTAEAVATYQQLLADQPQLVQRIRLAEAQHNLGLHYTQTGRPQEAAEALTAAVDGYCEAAETHPHAVHARLRAATAALGQAQAAVGTGTTAHPDRAQSRIRYARRWHEEAIRYPLPGIVVILGWRTDLAARQPRQRTIRDDLLAMVFDRNRAAAAAETTAAEDAGAATPAVSAGAASANRVSQLTATLMARVTSSPLLTPLLANGNITPLGRLVGLGTALIALVIGAVAIVAPGHHPSPNGPGVAQSPADATSPGLGGTGGPAAPGAAPGTGPTSSNGAGSSTGPTSSNGASSSTGPTSSNGASSSAGPGAPGGPTISISDTPCGQNQHAVAAPGGPSPTTVSRPNLNFASPSNHGVSMSARSRVIRTQTASLAGPSFAIRIDATHLVYQRFFIPGVTSTSGVDSRVVQTLQLAPGTYSFQFASGYYADFRFKVTQAGKVDYDPSYARFLSGTDTSTLTVSGFLVTLDASHLSGRGILLANMPYQDWITYKQVRMVPASYYGVQGPGGSGGFYFKLGLDGRFSYNSSLDADSGGFLKGNGTSRWSSSASRSASTLLSWSTAPSLSPVRRSSSWTREPYQPCSFYRARMPSSLLPATTPTSGSG
jgi:tetratricopeptide (TPR) repeat protein